MSSFRADRRLALAGLLALAGCGFTPALAPGGPAAGLGAGVEVDPPENRNEFDLVRRIEQRLGRSGAPRYRLSYQLDTRKEGVGVTPQQELIRYNLIGRLSYALHDLETGEVLTSGRVESFTGYSVGAVDTSATPPSTNATIATLAAERDAYARLMVALADLAVARLIATSADWAG
jgi:LPS-assembly lipoprotein